MGKLRYKIKEKENPIEFNALSVGKYGFKKSRKY